MKIIGNQRNTYRVQKYCNISNDKNYHSQLTFTWQKFFNTFLGTVHSFRGKGILKQEFNSYLSTILKGRKEKTFTKEHTKRTSEDISIGSTTSSTDSKTPYNTSVIGSRSLTEASIVLSVREARFILRRSIALEIVTKKFPFLCCFEEIMIRIVYLYLHVYYKRLLYLRGRKIYFE